MRIISNKELFLKRLRWEHLEIPYLHQYTMKLIGVEKAEKLSKIMFGIIYLMLSILIFYITIKLIKFIWYF